MKSFFNRVAIWLRRVLFAALVILAVLGGQWAYGYIEPPIQFVEKIVKVAVPEEKKPVPVLIRHLADEYRVSPLLLKALILQESGEGMRPDRMRYEPHLQRKFKRSAWMTDAEYKALATSFGLTQVVYGLHKHRCGLDSYRDLLDEEINIRCGLTVYRDCYDKQKAGDKLSRTRNALLCYNGGETYPDKVLVKLAEIVVEGL